MHARSLVLLYLALTLCLFLIEIQAHRPSRQHPAWLLVMLVLCNIAMAIDDIVIMGLQPVCTPFSRSVRIKTERIKLD